jgi:hypothetical protein
MIARLAIFPIAVALMASAVAAQAPDPAALDLARLLMSRDERLYDDADLGRFRSRIEAALLALEGSCDPSNTECQGAAATVAAQYAPALRQRHRETAEQLAAAQLAERMRPEEMARIGAWLRSGEGMHFLEAWEALREPRAIRRRREMQGDLARSAPAIFNPARALFRQRIVNIPKAAPR